MTKNLSIIIPNLNGQKYLESCLPSLVLSLKKISTISKYEVILVDNNSTDDSVSIFNSLLSKIDHSVIKNDTNFGFSPAINQGIDISQYNYVVLLNNDLVIAPNWFSKIIKEISSKFAVYCGTVLTKDGTKYESIGLNFEYKGKCTNINNGLPFSAKDLERQSSSVPIWGCSAAIAVYDKNILKKIGGYDSDFFAYEEDVDVCLRLHLLGYKTLLVPSAISYHLGGGTSSRMNNFRYIMDAKNWFYIIIKDYPLNIILKYFLPIFVERLRNLSGLTKATIRMYGLKSVYFLPLAYIKSYGEVIINLPKMLSKRHAYQSLLKS